MELPHFVLKKAGRRVYCTTGFSRQEIADLCVLVLRAAEKSGKASWPPCLGLYRSVVVTLSYLRRNRVQAELAESAGVSQPTVSRAICALTPLLAEALAGFAPAAEDLDPASTYVVDGTLLPCWSWRSEPGLFSGKHKATGMNVQVAATMSGGLAWISDAIPGSRHDSYCLKESGVLGTLDPGIWIGDKGYIGCGMITPFRKPPGGDLTGWQKEFSKGVNRIRYVIEQVIANFKTWRILHTDYRRPYSTFTETISAVVALHFYKLA